MNSNFAVVIGSLALFLAGGAAAEPLLGFTPARADAQRALEARFDAGLSATDIQARHETMAASPTHVGSVHGKKNAEDTLARFKAWGWDARIETFDVLFPTPIEVSLELLGDKPFKATLTEKPVSGDAPTAAKDVLPAYVAYQGDGDVTAELVYVNYGMPDDYKTLERMGISVKGKIVIVRYGAGWRGLKPKLAQEHGAVGCLIYSDPADDGYGAGDVYPKGAWRPDDGVQRGSVVDLPVNPGDPLTPGWGSTKGARRLAREEASSILKIPVLPISYGDARHFLAALDGEAGPKTWRGALAQTYKVGPGPAKVHLTVRSDWSQKRLYNVIATLKGATRPNEWVLRGNHRDGWVMGASDPLSGHEAMMEEAKSIGALVKGGWRPTRTIVYASWDGEEQGLLGSTEWAETHAKELTDKAVLYLNTDGNGRGPMSVQGSWSTERLVNDAAADVRDPETGADSRTRARAALQVRAVSAGAGDEDKRAAKIVAAGGDLPLGPLGSGSDYSPFVQHLGVASINLAYSGEEENDGVYHSLYDTYAHFHRFVDPDAAYQVTLAKTAGRIVLRSAEADVAPLRFSSLAQRVAGDVTELKDLASKTAERDRTVATLVKDGAYAQADDPTLKWSAPTPEPLGPELDLKPLESASAKLSASAEAYDAALASLGELPPARRARVNALLLAMERRLTDPAGLPGRPWFRHLISAPGLLTGYGAKTLPGVREAVEARRWPEAQAYVGKTAAALDAMSAGLDEAAAQIKG